MSLANLLWFKEMLGNKKLVEHLKKITLVITDVDGSLTDGTVHYDAQGEADRMYSPQDGHMIGLAKANGIKVAFLSGNAGASIVSRAKKLNIPEDLMILGSSKDKVAAVKKLQKVAGATSEQTLVFGDDILDSSVKQADPAIFFAAPNNSVFYIKPLADCITPNNAGAGSALRLVLDLLLYVQEKHLCQDLIKQSLGVSPEKNTRGILSL